MRIRKARYFGFLAIIVAIALHCSCRAETSPSAQESKTAKVPPKSLLCAAELDKEVFLAGEPLEVGARLKNISKKTLEFPDCWPLIIENFSVKTDSGRDLPYAKKRAEWIEKALNSEPHSWGPGIDRYAGRLDIADAYNIRIPGTYTVRLRWPLNASATEFAESEDVVVRVLPRGSLAARIRMVGNMKAIKKGGPLEAELTFTNHLPKSERMSKVSFFFSASAKNRNVFLWGVPTEKDGKKISSGWMETCDNRENKVTYDLFSARWQQMTSSSVIWLNKSIWDFIGGDDIWTFTVDIGGLLGGKRFKVSSEPVEIQIINERD